MTTNTDPALAPLIDRANHPGIIGFLILGATPDDDRLADLVWVDGKPWSITDSSEGALAADVVERIWAAKDLSSFRRPLQTPGPCEFDRPEMALVMAAGR
jgi:hypothetical protein